MQEDKGLHFFYAPDTILSSIVNIVNIPMHNEENNKNIVIWLLIKIIRLIDVITIDNIHIIGCISKPILISIATPRQRPKI